MVRSRKMKNTLNIKLIFFIFIYLSFNKVEAQQDLYKWGLEPYIGSFQFSPKVNLPKDFNSYTYGLKINRKINSSFSLQADLGGGNLKTENSQTFASADILLNFRFDNGYIINERAFLAPFLAAGVGYININPNLGELNYNKKNWNLKVESGLKFRLSDRINAILFLSAGIPIKSVGSYEYSKNSIFQKIGLSFRYNFGQVSSNFNGPSYYIDEYHEDLNPVNKTSYTSIIELEDSTFQQATDSAEIDLINYLDSNQISSFSKDTLTENKKIKSLLDTDSINMDSIPQMSIIDLDSLNDKIDSTAKKSVIQHPNKSDSIEIKKDTLDFNLLKIDTSSIYNPRILGVKDTNNIKINKVDQNQESTTNKPIEEDSNFKSNKENELDTNNTSKPIEDKPIQDKTPVIKNDKSTNNQSSNAAAKKESGEKLESSNSTIRESNTTTINKTKTIVVPVVIPKSSDKKTTPEIDSISELSPNKSNSISSTNFDNNSQNTNAKDSVLERILVYEKEISELLKKQQQMQQTFEERLIALENKRNTTDTSTKVLNNKFIPKSPVQTIIRDTIYKESTSNDKNKEEKLQIAKVKTLYFTANSSKIQNADINILNELLIKAKAEKETIYLLNGYSDLIGDANYNLTLSKYRAESVSNYLIKNGLAAERIIIRYFGEKQATSGTIETDRKVEIEKIIQQ